MSETKEIILNSTGAIGDIVIASALQKAISDSGYHTGIISKGFTLNLWDNLKNVSTYSSEDELPEESIIIDISNYLIHMPHSEIFQGDIFNQETRKGHLCQWMAYEAMLQGVSSEILENVSRDDVRVVLTEDEVNFGRNYIDEISKENNNLGVVVFNPYSVTKNRSLPKSTLEDVVKGIKEFAVPCILEPIAEEQYVEGMVRVGDRNLRNATSILLASEVYIGVDSGPLHMVNGAIQGTLIDKDIDDKKRKVIALIGSSHQKVVTYSSNQVIFESGGCPIAPCGAHGYVPAEEYGKRFDEEFFESNNPEKDKGGCRYQNHKLSDSDSAHCMHSIDSNWIIKKIKDTIIE